MTDLGVSGTVDQADIYWDLKAQAPVSPVVWLKGLQDISVQLVGNPKQVVERKVQHGPVFAGEFTTVIIDAGRKVKSILLTNANDKVRVSEFVPLRECPENC